jgi:UDP-N-acetyl-D-glucosamine/UDP-N-acetyl-D-galactosamine dehydrogenase
MSIDKTISVIGLGYVGLPLATGFSKHTKVIGFDRNHNLISNLEHGIDKNGVVNTTNLKHENLLWTTDPEKLKNADFHIVTVPTPVNSLRDPDLEMVFAATQTVAGILKKNDIIVYESTVYPGLTEEECIPLLESISGLVCGKDFFVGYSPERINPGDMQHTLENTIKVISAQDQNTLEQLAQVYSMIVKAGLHRVRNIRVAEAAKVIENTQRDINIALMNELALIFEKLDIDTADVLEAAGTKWNFLKFYPGLVGGHCIGVDPYYLTHKAIQVGYSPRVILSGRSVNDSMGVYVARMVVKQLIKTGIVIKDSIITILGVTFKENIPDVRNSRVIDIVHELESFDINVQVYDPLADKIDVFSEYKLELLDKNLLEKSDAVILAVTHQEFINGGWNYIVDLLRNKSGVVFDVKSVLPRDNKPENIILQRL